MECGDCTLCCTALPIPVVDSPAGETCKYCDKGCTIWDSGIPDACKKFNCTYSLSPDADISLRPDNTGVIFERITTKIYLALVSVDIWKTAVVSHHIDNLIEQGISVVVSSYAEGLIKIYTALGHKENKVRQIAIGLAK